MFSHAAAQPRPACPLVLAWDSVVDGRIAGFALYYGQTGVGPTNRLDVGAARTATVYNLSASANYFFYVVAYDAKGIESQPSNVLPFSPPALSALKIDKSTNGAARLQCRAAPNAVYRVEFTPSLSPVQWQSLNSSTADTNGYIIVSDPASASQAMRFYRAVLP